MSLGIRWLKFNAVGALGVAVQLGLLALLTHGFGWDYLWATAVAVELTLLHNFAWHERYTWADRAQVAHRPREVLLRLLGFHLGNGAVSLVGNVLLMRWLAGALGMPPLLANMVSIAACSLVNFAIGERFIFRAARPAGPTEDTAALAGLATACCVEASELPARLPAVRHPDQVALRERQEQQRRGRREGEAQADVAPDQEWRERPQQVEQHRQRKDAAELLAGAAKIEADARQPVQPRRYPDRGRHQDGDLQRGECPLA